MGSRFGTGSAIAFDERVASAGKYRGDDVAASPMVGKDDEEESVRLRAMPGVLLKTNRLSVMVVAAMLVRIINDELLLVEWESLYWMSLLNLRLET